jgi:hypothetical protein
MLSARTVLKSKWSSHEKEALTQRFEVQVVDQSNLIDSSTFTLHLSPIYTTTTRNHSMPG